MKRFMQYMFVLGLCSVFAAVDAQAQDDDFRGMVPEAGPAREIEIGTYESFKLDNGLKVIVVENHKVPRISYQLFIDRAVDDTGTTTSELLVDLGTGAARIRPVVPDCARLFADANRTK